MKKTIVALALALSTVTAAATDTSSLPSRSNPTAPVGGSLVEPKMWVGVNVGGAVSDGINRDAPWTVGVVGGYNVVRLGPLGLGVEGTYDYYFKKDGVKDNQRGALNVVYSPVELFGFKPYALAGVGAEARNTGIVKNGDARAIYNVGGGVKYAINKDWETDLRYRYVSDWAGKDRDANVVTFGLNYKF